MEKPKDIQSIEVKGDKTKIVWLEASHYGVQEKRSIETKVEAHQDFYSALRSLDLPLCIESELPQNEDEYIRHDILRVDIKWELNEKVGEFLMNASITSNRRMNDSNEPMKITSPMKCESDSEPYTLNGKTVEKIYALLEEAKLFISGKRADLFAETVK